MKLLAEEGAYGNIADLRKDSRAYFKRGVGQWRTESNPLATWGVIPSTRSPLDGALGASILEATPEGHHRASEKLAEDLRPTLIDTSGRHHQSSAFGFEHIGW